MSLLLTPSQQRSLDLSSHLSVTANAGAGKTSVLARRFVEVILRTDAKLSQIVAITFTEQAAGELRRKVHDVLLERERSGALRGVERRRVEEARNQLSSAVIGTIHSFCARILRMYPAEADVDASFTVVEGQDRARLIAESIAETFSDMMGRGDDTGPVDEFRALLRAVPPAKLERFLLRLFAQREQMYRYFRSRGEAGSGIGAEAGPLLDRIARSVVDRAVGSGWADRAREVAAAARGKGAGLLLGMLGRPGAPPGRERLEEVLIGADDLIFTKKAEFRSSFLGKVPADELPASAAAYLRAFEARYGVVLRSARAPGAAERTAAHRELIGTLERTFASAVGRYSARKEELGVLDFEDLQIKTVELLAREDARERLRSEYRFFLVDEFQDTNDLQYEILRGMAGDGASGNLFIVGDPKQSIYGFRNADVGIFYDARADIAVRCSRPGGPPDRGTVVLAESFRPLPELAAFVNTIFSGLMRRGSSRHEVDYDAIVVGRSDRSRGAVELLLVPADPPRDRSAALRAECAGVARRLRELAAGGRAYGDCAVLLRDRTNLPALEKALEEAGVPYLLAGGVGFFQTQEVYDFLNYLRFLVSPEDDAALAGVLRSPFFGLSDADLFAIATAQGDSFWEKLRRSQEPPGPAGRFRRAVELLGTHRSLADRVPVPRLLRRIAADTGWMGVIAGVSHGPQRRENFLKLLELARLRGSLGPFSLYDFMAYLDHRAEEEEREGQASTAAAGTAVRVMTVHAAKGLEFGVVILPFLDRANRSDSEPIVDTDFGIGFRVSGEDEQPPLYAFLRALSEEKRLAEEKRIFYVACTRARDVLILSGNERIRAGATAPLAWVGEAAAAAGVAERDGRLDFGVVNVRLLDASGGAPAYRDVGVPLVVPVFRSGGGEDHATAGKAGAALPEEPRPRPRVLTGPLVDTRGGESYSATMLKSYLECPARYYLTYVLGIDAGSPDDDLGAGGRGAGSDDDDRHGHTPGAAGSAALEGELTHQALSALTAADGDDAIAARVAALAGTLPAARDHGDLGRRVAETVASFARSAAGRAILSRPGARTEYQVSASIGDAVVMGKIDRLFEDEKGAVEFLDYKTDAVSAGDVASRAEAHRHQVALYAFLLSRLYGQRTVRGTLVFLKAGPASVSLDFGGDDFSLLERSIRETIAAIRSGSFAPAATPCRECPGGGGPCPVVPARP